MESKKYRQIRALIIVFIAALISSGVVKDNQILSYSAMAVGILFLFLVRSKAKVIVDERDRFVRQKAAQITYAIFAPTIGVGSFLLITLGRNTPYLFSLGQILAYLSLFLLALYSFSYYFYNRKFGGSYEE